MHKKKSNFKKFYKHFVIFTTLIISGLYFINFLVQNQEKRYLELQTELLASKYQTNYSYFKIMSQDIYSIYEKNTLILQTITQANNANSDTQSKLRKNLYTKLQKRYKRLKNMGVLQLHFHLANNTSFLRMHNPEKFGDDLTDFRESVVLTNKTLKPHNGFEVGKAKHGFRFVYPLFNKKKHIGSLEISFSSKKLLQAVLDNYSIHTHFLISKDEINKTVWKKFKKTIYQDSIESKDFYLETISHTETNNNIIHKGILQKNTIKIINKLLKTGKSFSMSSSYNHESIVGSFIAIQNITQTKTIAYLAVYSESDYLDSLYLEKRYIQLLFISIIFLIFIFSVYVTINNAKLKEMAHFDELTSLPNRAFFYIELEIELNRAKRNNTQLAVMFIDLDGFKAVNDTFGHDIGDKLLIEVSSRLSKCIRNVDLVARLGGDEFTVVLTDLQHKNDSMLVANKIIQSLSKDFLLNNKIINIGASIGISHYPELALDSDTLIKQSDTAMYMAKENGKNQAIFYEANKKDK